MMTQKAEFDAVLFDFDGTVADTSPGIKEGLLHTFALNKMPSMTMSEMDKFIGPPLDDSFKKYCGVTDEVAKKMVGQFRAHYHTKAIDKFVIYDGLENALDVLKRRDIALCVATSKPEVMAIHILKKAGLFDYFDVIQGATLDGSLIKKNDIIGHLMKNEMLSGKRLLMVGDTEFDIRGAHENGIKALWVEYGFGTKENAKKENPEFTAKNIEEMTELFKRM